MNTNRFIPLVLVAAFAAAAGAQIHPAHGQPSAADAPPPVSAPFATPPLVPGTPDVPAIVARVTPAVVNVTTEQAVKAPARDFDWPFGIFPFGEPGDRGGHDGDSRTYRRHGLGSGFIVDAEGLVVTNEHVVKGADSVRVRLFDDRELKAKVIGRDERLDLAVLKIDGAKNLPVASLGNSEALRVGESVIAIGNPFGLGDTVTMGIVSAKSRAIGAGPYDDFIQTDAAINPGNSGGPLFNVNGQVVGINTAINPNGQGIGFAVPVDVLKGVLTQLVETGHVARGQLGATIQSIDTPLQKALGLDSIKGALVGEVERGGPADRAGLRSGDVILGVDKTPLLRAQDLPRRIASHAPGSRVLLQVVREKAPLTIDVTLGTLRDATS